MKRSEKITLAVVVAVVCAIIAGLIIWNVNKIKVSFSINKTYVSATLDDTQPVVVKAYAQGKPYQTDPKELKCTVTGEVDAKTPGTYTLTASAEYALDKKTETFVVEVKDDEAPVIELVDNEGVYTIPGEIYKEEGYTAHDNLDGDLTDQVLVTRKEKEGKVVYSVSDKAGNETVVERVIKYADIHDPEIELIDGNYIKVEINTKYDEPGVIATDDIDGDITDRVEISGEVDPTTLGVYHLNYTVSDEFGNVTTVERRVQVYDPEKVIYLTFDDGPSPFTPHLLDILDKYDVKATFFVVNTRSVELIKDEYERGHSIAIHTYTHNYQRIYRSAENFYEDLYAMQDKIYELTGYRTTLMRFPGGSSNQVSVAVHPGIMSFLTKDVEEKGFTYFDWSADCGDAGKTTDTEVVYKNVIGGIQAYHGGVILQHDIFNYSINAVEKIIKWGLENGYSFMPLDENSPTAHHHVRN